MEAEANKAAAKYDNSSIDFQIDFYKKEGLTPYSLAKLPITSGKSGSISFLFDLSYVYILFQPKDAAFLCLCKVWEQSKFF